MVRQLIVITLYVLLRLVNSVLFLLDYAQGQLNLVWKGVLFRTHFLSFYWGILQENWESFDPILQKNCYKVWKNPSVS